MKYVLILSLLMTACNIPYAPEISYTPDTPDAESRADGESRDARNNGGDISNAFGPKKDTALWLNDQEISVNTDFPAPSWFR